MEIQFKIDVLTALREKGYTSYRIRKEKIMGESTMTQLRNGELVSWENLSRICGLLQCQPGDLLEYVPGKKDSAEG